MNKFWTAKVWTAGALAFAIGLPSVALSAEPIEGTWLRPSTNTLVKYVKRGSQFCGTVQTGAHKGKSIGCLAGSGENYKGEVIAVDEGKTYTGKASIKGDTMKLSGCVLGGLICKGEDWKRQ
ncbi:MAG: DUF2147 domain-containing protein [Nitratireductor sp.]|nr:DUF2147 domain-containing protein [Nitratireductor sp.]